jgi:hypothetical protein
MVGAEALLEAWDQRCQVLDRAAGGTGLAAVSRQLGPDYLAKLHTCGGHAACPSGAGLL